MPRQRIESAEPSRDGDIAGPLGGPQAESTLFSRTPGADERGRAFGGADRDAERDDAREFAPVRAGR